MKRFSKVTAIDFETHQICNEFPYPKPICLSYSGSLGEGIAVGALEMESILSSLLADPDHLIVAHNIRFESIVTEEWFPNLRKPLWDSFYKHKWFCTMLYQQLINHISKVKYEKVSLADLVKKYFETDISETKKNKVFSWRINYKILEDIPLELWPKPAIDYSLEDSRWALKLYNKYMEVEPNLEYKDHILAEFTLNLMGKTGMLVAKDRVELLEKEILEHINPRYDFLISEGYAERHPKTGKLKKKQKKLRDHIKESCKTPRYTAKNTIATSDEAMDSYLETNPEDKVIKAFKDIGEYEKAYTAFVKRLLLADPVIRTEYNSLVSSGRSSARSCSFYPSVNIQQMPRSLSGVTWDVRNCFIPPEGFEFVSIDYAALELIAVASQLLRLVGYSKMAEMLNSGDRPVDPHSVLGAEILTKKLRKFISYEEFKAKKKEGEFKDIRTVAKEVGLGRPGGEGIDVMRGLINGHGIFLKYKELHVSDKEWEIDNLVSALRSKYPNVRKRRIGKTSWALTYDEVMDVDRLLLTKYPELKTFLRNHHEKYQTGEIRKKKNDFGEWEDHPAHRYSTHGVTRDWCTYTELCNGLLMQTPGAMGAKRAAAWMVEKYYRHEDVIPLAFIHDEIIFAVRKCENKWGYIEDIALIMCKALQLTCPGVRVTVEASTMDYWSKSVTLEDRTYWLDPSDKELKSNV